MSRKLILSAMFVAGSLFAVGCGGTDPSKPLGEKAKEVGEKAKEGAKELGEKAKEGAKELGEKVKEGAKDAKEAIGDLIAKAKTALGKDSSDIEKAIAAVTKAKGEEKDAEKAKNLGKIEAEASTLFGDLKKKMEELSGLKDVGALEGANKAIGEIITKLKTLLKDYLPK